MNKPLLIVITGRPASGKTTLARHLSQRANLPLLSRDEIKEGYITTTGIHHNQHSSIDLHVYETFFHMIDLLITQGVSIIIEAAFQHKLWQPKLYALLNKADIKIIICSTDPELAKTRFDDRLMNEPGRKTFHGENPILSSNEKVALLIEQYENVSMEVPTLQVDTTNNYNPNIDVVVDFIKRKNSRG